MTKLVRKISNCYSLLLAKNKGEKGYIFWISAVCAWHNYYMYCLTKFSRLLLLFSFLLYFSVCVFSAKGVVLLHLRHAQARGQLLWVLNSPLFPADWDGLRCILRLRLCYQGSVPYGPGSGCLSTPQGPEEGGKWQYREHDIVWWLLPPQNFTSQDDASAEEQTKSKYVVRPPKDLTSKFRLRQRQKELDKVAAEEKKKKDEEAARIAVSAIHGRVCSYTGDVSMCPCLFLTCTSRSRKSHLQITSTGSGFTAGCLFYLAREQ